MTIKVGQDREIKFDKTLRFERQKNYDVQNYELIPFSFQTGDRRVYKNFNFSIFVDDYCNADCKFCVAQLRYAHKHQAYNKPHISNPQEYLQRLDEILQKIRPLNPSISITGGEPTLSPILPDILKLVDKYGFRKRTITTNGSGLFIKREEKTILQHLIDNNWDHLNISRVSHIDEENKRIMRYNVEKEYCSNEMLKKVLKELEGTNLKHRLSCLLLKECVNDVEKMKEYLDFYRSIGVNNVIFRELMDYDSTAINTEKIQYCIDNKIRLNDIWTSFDKYPEFKPYLNILGYYYYVEIYHYNDMTVTSESANLNQQYIEKTKYPDVVYEMIFHNNGNLCGSWIDEEDILDKYQK